MPDAADPHSQWVDTSKQLVQVFARIGIDPEEQQSLLHDSIDADALNTLAAAPTITISFELWDHWVCITPDVIELYAMNSRPEDASL